MPSPHTDSRRLNTEALNERRRLAVRLRLSGMTLQAVADAAELSVPTVLAAMQAFERGGWEGVAVRKRGRIAGSGRRLSRDQALKTLALLDDPAAGVWSDDAVRSAILKHFDVEMGTRTVAQYLGEWGISQSVWRHERGVCEGALFTAVPHEIVYAPEAGCEEVSRRFLVARDVRQRLAFVSLAQALGAALEALADHFGRAAEGRSVTACLGGFDLRRVQPAGLPHGLQLMAVNLAATRTLLPVDDSALPRPTASSTNKAERASRRSAPEPFVHEFKMTHDANTLTHLQRLEAESIHILREVVAEADNPVMLYSIGKDSAVMLHLAMKAFYPAVPPFPLLHVDTRWKFQDMYRFRDKMAQQTGMDLLVHINPEGVEKDINPFTHGSAIHTDIMKTEGLKQALDQYGFDAAFGGARRDEEKSRAKERVFSFRSAQHRWDPKSQRPELWKLYNARKHKGESIRVFPLSNWTELDIWQYIYLENIPIVPLYYAAVRPVVERDGTLIMVDDERMPLKPGEVPMMKKVRFRTLGCYPLTGAIESEADTLPAIIQEMLLTRTSERQGRVIDHDSAASMEKKKQEGYF